MSHLISAEFEYCATNYLMMASYHPENKGTGEDTIQDEMFLRIDQNGNGQEVPPTISDRIPEHLYMPKLRQCIDQDDVYEY